MATTRPADIIMLEAGRHFMQPIGSTGGFSAARLFEVNTLRVNKSLENLATGRKLNRASDDPAGMITSNNLLAALAALDADARSVDRVDQVANVADSRLGAISDLLIEAEGLAVANANTAGLSTDEIAANQLQLDSILASVDRLASHASFNGQSLFDGQLALKVDEAELVVDAVSTGSLGNIDINGTTQTLAATASGGALGTTQGHGAAGSAQQTIRAARGDISRMRGEIGAFQQNTVQSRRASISVQIENVSAAESIIADTDFALEIAKLNRSKILQQASLLALKKSASTSESILNLLA